VLEVLDPVLRSREDPFELSVTIEMDECSEDTLWQFELTRDDVDKLIPDSLAQIASREASTWTTEDRQKLGKEIVAMQPANREVLDRSAALSKSLKEAEAAVPTAMVMEERPTPRQTYILTRGAYDAPGELVTAATPAILPPMQAGLPPNRLGLAHWLVDPANPLPSRVTVNRLWQMLSGTGLVETAEDFGAQGEPPSHPELIDWLASEFIASGWNVKAMLRLMVTSDTYRQDSRQTPDRQERDPENRLLSRGPRFRMHGEFIRDQALAASGLLVRKIGGPSVKPYHPAGLYEQVSDTQYTKSYEKSRGEDLYRRSVYTYWKRSVPNPAMFVFDAPLRESCTLRRGRTNTALQALNLLNDPTYVEAARQIAQRMLLEGGDDIEQQLTYGFRLVVARTPRPAEISLLKSAWERALRDFKSDSAAATSLLEVGESKTSELCDRSQLAALTMVASTILNLDEAVTKE
jgi:hypothetical protein